LREVGCEVELFNTDDGRYDVTQFPQYDCVAFGSPDYYSYIAGNLKQFMDDHYIADVRVGMQGLKGKPYALFCVCSWTHTAAGVACVT
jgi:multimeric flavodoxin WrbA